MGKSTSAQILARKFGFVYYEADCFGVLKNPFVPLNVDNPSMAQMHQKSLKGPGMKERQAILARARPLYGEWVQDKDYDKELFAEFHRHLARDIRQQKRRIGGDWAIATVILTAGLREVLRYFLPLSGKPVTFTTGREYVSIGRYELYQSDNRFGIMIFKLACSYTYIFFGLTFPTYIY